ncbi:profilin-like protein [Stemphylium lycopersici]|uniref:Profilin n=1 Tax=Stemphylium lycopersici TaxID=183478 RepID=A0A364N3B4_STELY|nr:profilin [Stemphylium lycopersici]RAR05278.1 profilin-like protein [Stemphylium lycopersici]RAR10851.1 profilin-like protein [Stemphylium lycopersici]
MSWQAYVDTSLVGTGNIDKALICDVEGATAWAESPGFSLTGEERAAIAKSFSDKSEPKKVISDGVKVNGVKYMTIEASEDALKAKKGKEGLVAFKTAQAVIIAHHPDTVQTPNAFNSVVELGEYLKKHSM